MLARKVEFIALFVERKGIIVKRLKYFKLEFTYADETVTQYLLTCC